MKFRLDAIVFSVDNERVGHISRVVLDRETKEVTHIVVREGVIFSKEKVVPINLIAAATDDRILLRGNVKGLQHLPDFEEEHYIVKRDEEYVPPIPSQHALPPLHHGATAARRASKHFRTERTVKEIERNIPEGTIALEKGAQVISADGEHVGVVECVLTHAGTDRISRFLISEGAFLKDRKLVPTLWVSSLEDGKVHLGMESHVLERLHGDRE